MTATPTTEVSSAVDGLDQAPAELGEALGPLWCSTRMSSRPTAATMRSSASPGREAALVRAGSRDDVVSVMRIAHEHRVPVVVHVGTAAIAQIVATFMLSYAVLRLDLPTTTMMTAIAVAYIGMLATSWPFGITADRIGRRKVFLAGCFVLAVGALPMFWLVDTGTGVLITIGLFIGLVSQFLCNQVEASWLAELFPPEVRSVHRGQPRIPILRGIVSGTAPVVAVFLLEWAGGSWAIALYLMILAVISAVCALTARETLHDRATDGSPRKVAAAGTA